MYLYVFVFIIMTIMGLYTELFSLRIARVAENQKALAEVMFVWHGGAHNLATTEGITTAAVNGCSVSPNTTPNFRATLCSTTLSGLVVNGEQRLPPGYDYANVKFNSRLIENGGQKYLITYVLPTETILGYSADQIRAQMYRTDYPPYLYGVVASPCPSTGEAGRWFVTGAFDDGTGTAIRLCYSVPTGVNGIDIGSVGFISWP
ncbi:MAG: hypothetical protein EOM37_07540 [Proteobacteria bacterium]|nr:hypothetical protein [Pseudomonadota bacterium]